MSDFIFIKGNVPSSKNSRVFNYKLKRSFMNKNCTNYVNSARWEFAGNRSRFKKLTEGVKFPLCVEFTFIRDTRHRFDLINALQIVQDMMVKHGWIEDDNSDILCPSFGQYRYDKENPGVEIRIIKTIKEEVPV